MFLVALEESPVKTTVTCCQSTGQFVIYHQESFEYWEEVISKYTHCKCAKG